MTDEEKAEEYSKGKAREHYNFLFEENNNGSPADFARLCYLDGLAEGRKEKWHDLRKDPTDLPKENGEYWCYVNYYGFQHRTVYWSNNQFELSEVIAWCELPKFEEE